MNMSRLSMCLRILFCDIRNKGFLSILTFCLQTLWNSVSPTSYSSPEPVKQSLNCIQCGVVRMCKEEAIVVMEKLGLSVECDGDGIEDYGEQEISQMFENGAGLEEVEEAFDVFDENKDGFIDAGELQRVLCCLGLERDLMQCQKMINAVDQNGDELVDRDEFVKLMEQSFFG